MASEEEEIRTNAFDRLNKSIEEFECVLAKRFAGREHHVELSHGFKLWFRKDTRSKRETPGGDYYKWGLFIEGPSGGLEFTQLTRAAWRLRTQAASKVEDLVRQLEMLRQQDVTEIVDAAALFEKHALALVEKEDD